jgi:excinuclease ABC subunit B
MPQEFQLESEFQPAGDQPQAIEAMIASIESGRRHQTLLGVTGSGKTFTMANVIQAVQRPALIISHNKTLAAQLYSEFKHFFPNNAVGYFISYYDYYLPEAYIPQTDTYIAKDAHINEEIEKLRLAATSSLFERRDVIIVASVSCIYGLGSPEDFSAMSVHVETGTEIERNDLLRRLVELQYDRNDTAPGRGNFRVSGDTVDVYPAYRDDMVRIEFWGDEVDSITRRDALTLQVTTELDATHIFPAKQFVMPYERMENARDAIKAEMKEQVAVFESDGRLVEAQRIRQRTMYDLEMMRELGYCSGIENYSRHLAGREPGSKPFSLIDYFPEDFVTIVDESHATLPQIRGMFKADRSRKSTLVDHGFRLPSALDNRPLNFDEFQGVVGQQVYVSATPGSYEIEHSVPIKQVIRPTGLLDPEVILRPLANQIDDLIAEVRECAESGERVLVTTLTKRTAEDLSDYLGDLDARVKYIHSEIDAIERVEILRDLRRGDFDCLIGVNLLREGLDLPEVALVAILDADKEGFLRSETSLMQTAGRAARHADGRVILYADRVTASMQKMIDTCTRRREQQQAYNEQHNIVPTTVRRRIEDSLHQYSDEEPLASTAVYEEDDDYDVQDVLEKLRTDMLEAAEALEFERAAVLRDQIRKLEQGKGEG